MNRIKLGGIVCKKDVFEQYEGKYRTFNTIMKNKVNQAGRIIKGKEF